jgi:hypothetical protein
MRFKLKNCIWYTIYVYFNTFPFKSQAYLYKCWCQELVGTFLTSKKLFDFTSRKERQILMKFNIK